MNDPHRLSMLSFVKDLPNIVSLLGLMSAVVGIYFAIIGVFYASIIGILWAVLFDWWDGLIASKMKGRTKDQAAFGGHLDSLIDIVSFGVLPAIILLSYGNYSLWFLPGGFALVAGCAIRLSYFNVYGLIDSKTYRGFPLDNNGIVFAAVFLVKDFFTHSTFAIIIYSTLILLSALNLSSISIPKFGGKWVYALVCYVLVLTGIFGWKLWNHV